MQEIIELRLVFKFGGTSLAGPDRIRNACSLVKHYIMRGNRLVVVCSAMGDTTDHLLALLSAAEEGRRDEMDAILTQLESDHLEATRGAVDDGELRRAAEDRVRAMLLDLRHIISGIYFLRESTPKSRDLILSFGERLSTWIFTCSLRSMGVGAEYFEGGDAGIVTDSEFGYATPLFEQCLTLVRERLEPVLSRGSVAVVTGFIGRTPDGAITTLGRGGSDLTATLLGWGLGADEVWLWTDVDGLMTTDPRILKTAKVIPQLSYDEAIEMAVFGAKGLHPRALEASYYGGIRVRIKNTFNPSAPGTLITSSSINTGTLVKAVLLLRDVAMITVKGATAVGRPGSAARILQSLANAGINIVMISQSASESSISLIVARRLADRAVEAIKRSTDAGMVQKIECEKDVAVVAVVGEGMKGTPGVASRVFGAVAKRGINVRMIAQGSSELNISFVVKESDGVEAVKAIHEDYGLGA
jgi:aspartate kinase